MSHTPGPWYAAKDYYGGWSVRTTPAEATNIDGENVVFQNTGRSSGDPSEADARLCAAAPDLLNACITLLNTFEEFGNGSGHDGACLTQSGDDDTTCDCGTELARAAVRKATEGDSAAGSEVRNG